MAESDELQRLITDPIVPNFRKVKGTILYRSSSLDNVGETGIELLKKLQILNILDLRSPEGFEDIATDGKICLTDSYYQAISVTYSSWAKNIANTFKRSVGQETEFNYKVLAGRSPAEGACQSKEYIGRRLFVNLVEKEFALGVLRDVIPWYKVPWIVFLMICFVSCRTKLFLKEFARLGMNPMGIKGQYTGIVTYCGETIRASLTLLSESNNVPTVICCAQGKDRTGIISALVMAVCGASREELIQEYAASKKHVELMSDTMRRYTDSYYLKPEFGTAEPETMEHLLDHIDNKYGSIPDYLESIGFGEEQQLKLKENVIERAV